MSAATDFNDLAAVVSLDQVRRQVEQATPTVVPPEWPDPILPGTMRTPPIPADVLPTWMGDMAQAVSNATQTPPALAVMSCLAVVATVLQRRFEVAPYGDDYTEPLSLWTVTASPSGTRKSAVITAMLGPLVRWEKLLRDRMRPEIARVNATRAVARKRVERLLQDAAKAKGRRRARGNP